MLKANEAETSIKFAEYCTRCRVRPVPGSFPFIVTVSLTLNYHASYCPLQAELKLVDVNVGRLVIKV